MGRSPCARKTEACTATMNAGCACDFHVGALPALDWQTLRLLVGDSSISARMTRRSSVADTTGNSMTRAHASANTDCNAESRPDLRVDARHSQ